MRPLARYAVITSAVAGLMVALGGSYLWYYWELKIYHGYTPLPFSREAWAAADPDARGHMLNDLLQKHPLKGKMVEEVQTLLGPADRAGQFGLSYRVGFLGFNPRGMFVFPNTLHIELGKDERVSRVYTSD